MKIIMARVIIHIKYFFSLRARSNYLHMLIHTKETCINYNIYCLQRLLLHIGTYIHWQTIYLDICLFPCYLSMYLWWGIYFLVWFIFGNYFFVGINFHFRKKQRVIFWTNKSSSTFYILMLCTTRDSFLYD